MNEPITRKEVYINAGITALTNSGEVSYPTPENREELFFASLIESLKLNVSHNVSGETEYGGTLVDDLNTIEKSGFYSCTATANGAPNSNNSWLLTHINSNVGTLSATQRATAINTTLSEYVRVKVNNVWEDWVSK